MTESTAGPQRVTADRLESWKEIAAYLRRDVTTVQRWEKRESMPVHRHVHDKLGSVYALRSELDAWSRGRAPQPLPVRAPESTIVDAGNAGDHPASGPLRRWNARLAYAAIAAGILVGLAWFVKIAPGWHDPLAQAQFQAVTTFEGTQQAAAISRDGTFVAFLSNQSGRTDVWLTQAGSGQFHNLTNGTSLELVNPQVRTITFSPDGATVYFWARQSGSIGIWSVPILGGEPRLLFDNVAELDWSHDGGRVVYHSPGPGDPMFVSTSPIDKSPAPIFTAPAGQHAHFPVWSPDDAFIYFVEGSVPDQMDIWRIRPAGGAPERITFHNARVAYPVFIDARTLLYVVTDGNGGPWIYSVDVNERVPHRVSPGLDRYSSLSVGADGRRLLVTVASPKESFWRLPISDVPVGESAARRITLTTGSGSSPRLAATYLAYVCSTGTTEGVCKLADGTSIDLWSAPGAQLIGAPAIAPDGQRVAFSVKEGRRTALRVVNSDGTHARVVSDTLDLSGAPAWTPDGRFMTVAADQTGTPRLFSVSVENGAVVPLLSDYAAEPVWSGDGRFVLYSGPDIGTTFAVKALDSGGRPYPISTMRLTRGGRHLTFLPGGHVVVALKGEIAHKDLWTIDLETGHERQLTNFGLDFVVRDFDVTPDGREIVVERVEDPSDIAILTLAGR